MLANPEDPNWSWTGDADKQRGYTYIDISGTIILSFAETIDGDLFTATWLVSQETWQEQKAAILASLQTITCSPKTVNSK